VATDVETGFELTPARVSDVALAVARGQRLWIALGTLGVAAAVVGVFLFAPAVTFRGMALVTLPGFLLAIHAVHRRWRAETVAKLVDDPGLRWTVVRGVLQAASSAGPVPELRLWLPPGVVSRIRALPAARVLRDQPR